MLVAAGCSTGHTSTADKKQQKRIDRDKQRNTETAETTPTDDGAMYYPTFSDQKVLKLERNGPEETRVGEEYPYSIKVTNVSDAPAHNIVVREHVNGELQLVQKEGSSRLQNNRNSDTRHNKNQRGWHIGVLQPGDSRTLNLMGIAQEEGTIKSCLSTDFESRLCSSTKVTDPKITLRRKFVNEDGEKVNAVYQCDEVYSMYRVKNVGSGSTGAVTVNEEFTEGITANDSSTHSYTSDTISAGDTSDHDVRLQLSQNSTYTGRATAETDSLSVRSNEASLTIMKPELDVQVTGPEREFIDRDVTHRVSVENTSDDPAIKSFVKVELPENVKRVSTSLASPMENGRVNIGRLDAGESRSFDITFRPTTVSTLETGVSAGAYCVETKTSSVSTSIEGHPAIGMEVTDTLDPVKVGETTRYLINIKNQGTAADKKVRLRATLPEGTEFVKAEGETEVRAEGRTLTFEVPRTLEAGEDFNWDVHVRATKANSGYFTLKLDSSANSRTVTEEESTNMVE